MQIDRVECFGAIALQTAKRCQTLIMASN